MKGYKGLSRIIRELEFAFFLTVLFLPSLALGAAYEFFGLGVRADSMGGAFIALADDWTDIYWNPAGLGQLKGRRWGTALFYMDMNGWDNDSTENVSLPFNPQLNIRKGSFFFRFHPTEPERFREKQEHFPVVQPSIGGYLTWLKSWGISEPVKKLDKGS